MTPRFQHKYLGYNDDLDHKEYCCDIYGYLKDHYKCVGYCKYYSSGYEDHIVYNVVFVSTRIVFTNASAIVNTILVDTKTTLYT